MEFRHTCEGEDFWWATGQYACCPSCGEEGASLTVSETEEEEAEEIPPCEDCGGRNEGTTGAVCFTCATQ